MNIKKKVIKSSLIGKVIILLIISFGIKLVFSCTPYIQNPIKMSYNKISVLGIDNSGRFMDDNNAIDTIYSDAVALKLTLSDTLMLYSNTYLPNTMQVYSFQTIMADSRGPSFIPQNKVINIKIKTLLDISDSIKAGDEISEHILCSDSYSSYMYNNIKHGISRLNGIQNYANSSIILILKTPVKNTNAQFEVIVTLESGEELLSTTKLFTIKES